MARIEKAFAVQAEAGPIWDALWADLTSGDPNAYSLERSNRPQRLVVDVRLAGVPCRLTYSIEPKDAYTEVAAEIEPLSWQYGFYQFLTFGHLRRNLEMLLVNGLVNLKEAVEEPEEAVEQESDPP